MIHLPSGRVDTLGEFQGYDTAGQAGTVAKRAAVLAAYHAAGWGTCPTANGRDLELWEGLAALAERAKSRETAAATA